MLAFDYREIRGAEISGLQHLFDVSRVPAEGFQPPKYRTRYDAVVDVDLKFNSPELRVTINRDKASQLGVSIADISSTLQLAMSNLRYGYFTINGKQYDVVGELLWNYRDAPYDLKDLYVRNAQGEPVSLDNLVNIQTSTAPPTIYHYNRYKSATISASLAPGKTQGEGIVEMQKIARSLGLI